MAETIELKYVIEAGQAKRDLASLESATNKVGDSSSKAATGWARLTEGMKGAQQRLGPTAAAISGVSAALGENAGQAGKAVAAAGQMAAAFGSGGPAGVAIVAMTFVVNALQKAWEDELKAQDAAQNAAVAGAVKAGAQRRQVEADIAALRKAVSGPETGSQAGDRVQAEIDAAKASSSAVLAARNAMKVANTEAYFEARKAFEDERRILDGVIERLEVKKGFSIAAANRENAAKPKTAAKRDVVGPDEPTGGIQAYRSIQQEAADEAAKKAASELADFLVDVQVDQFNKEQDIFEARLAMREDDAKKARDIGLTGLKAREADYEAHQAEIASMASAGAAVVAGASTQLLSDLISGQDKAFEHFGLSIMAQAGQSLVGSGVSTLGAGIGEAAVSGGVLGGPAIAAGLGLITAGVALGGTAGGLGALLGGATSGGKTPAATERGTSGRGGGGSGRENAGTTINIVYGGASGPTAEQGAIAVTKAMKKADKRGLNGK